MSSSRAVMVLAVAAFASATLASPEAAAAAPTAPGDAVFPFVLPWDDASPGVTDMSHLLDKPAGRRGHIEVSPDGHFAAGDDRIRFFGINLSFGGGMPTREDASRLAGRLAKFGVNVVRFHHMDTGAWPGGIRDGQARGSGELHPEALDRLGFFIAQLQQRGIYANVNLLVGRPFKAADGLPVEIEQLDWKDRHLIGFYDARHLELQKEYARRLLLWRNPHTGLTFAEDPAVAFVEINNEQGLVHGWLGGNVDRLPDNLRTPLRQQWNDWLKARHATTAALRTAWQEGEERPGAEFLRNALFTQQLQNWSIEQHEGARVEATVVDGSAPGAERNIMAAPKAVQLKVVQPGRESWHVQFLQNGLKLAAGRPYTVRFWAKASAPRTIGVNVSQAHEPWQNLGLSASPRLSTEWQEFRYVFNASQADANARLSFIDLGGAGSTVWLGRPTFKPGGVFGLQPAENLESSNLPLFTKTQYGERTTAAQRDWMRFLTQTEDAYWTEMLRFLKQDLHVKGLITGTIAGCSPLNLQSRMDWVDTHSYWQHPRWTGGRDWDAENWVVENRSVVNERGGTIAGLTMRRVLGKPHACTEYNHPAPNTYSSEGLLLLAAYAALQDWDAIYVYSYAHNRSDGWDGRKINGFFDVDQHPTKMATFPPAAALFVRGDVRAANQIVAATLPPEREVDLLRTARNWDLVSARHLGIPLEAGLLHRVGVVTGNSSPPAGALQPETVPATADTLRADTGELTWDLSRPGRGVAVVNTPRSKAVIGFGGGRRFDLDPFVVEPGAGLQSGWSAITITEKAPDRWFVTATGYAENTEMKWKDAGHSSVGRDWGTAPSRVEGVEATLTLRLAGARVKAWALDERGQRREALEVETAGAEGTLVRLGPAARTLWYEIERER